MKIRYAKKTVKYIESLDKSTKQRIKAGIALELNKKLVLEWVPDYTAGRILYYYFPICGKLY